MTGRWAVPAPGRTDCKDPVGKTIAILPARVHSPPPRNFMSQHPSLKGKGAIQAKRSVLKRFERVELLKKRGQFKEGQRVIGLPKTKPED